MTSLSRSRTTRLGGEPRSMALRTALAVGALAAGACLVAGAPPASAHLSDFVVSGNASGKATVVLREELAFDTSLPVEAGGGRSYAAAVIERVDGPEPRAVVTAFTGKAFGTTIFSSSNVDRLSPGRYEVYLLTDGPARIGFPLANEESYLVVPKTKTPVKFTTAKSALSRGASNVKLALPGGVPTSRRGLVAVAAAGLRVEQTYACVTVASSCPGRRISLPAMPAPLPALPPVDPPVTVPSVQDDALVVFAPRAAEARQAIAGVTGGRLDGGELKAALISFGT